MSAGITSDGIEYLLNLMRNAEQPVPSYYVALVCNLPPGFTSNADELDEPVFDEYSRGQIINDSGFWEIVDNTLLSAVDIPFPAANYDWGQIHYWALCDQPKGLGGRVIYAGEFDEVLFVEAGDAPVIESGGLGLPMEGSQWLTVMP